MKKLITYLTLLITLFGLISPVTYAKDAHINSVLEDSYTVLALDVSGSMEGPRLSSLKEASKSFCKNMINRGNNYIAIVAYESRAYVACDFTNNLDELYSSINSLSAYGGTNISGGLELAGQILEFAENPQASKNIMIFSDGLPERGASKDEGPFSNKHMNGAYYVAQGLQEKYDIYSVGFFQYLDPDSKIACEAFMQSLQNCGYWNIELIVDFDRIFSQIENIITANYSFQILDDQTLEPIENATLSYEYNPIGLGEYPQTTYTSDSNGLISATFPADFIKSPNNMISISAENYAPQNLSIDDYSNQHSNEVYLVRDYNLYLPEFKTNEDTIKGPEITSSENVFEKVTFTPFEMKSDVDLSFINYKVETDPFKGEVKVKIGFKQGSVEDFNNRVDDVSSSSSFLNMAHEYNTIPMETGFGVKGEIYILGTLTYSIDGSELVLKDGKIAVGSKLKTNLTVPLGTAPPYITGSLTGDIYGNGKYTAEVLSTNLDPQEAEFLLQSAFKTKMKVGAGLGKKGIVHLEGGLMGDLNTEITDLSGLTPNSLEDVMTMKADLSGYYEMGLFVWTNTVEVAKTTFNLYPEEDNGSVQRIVPTKINNNSATILNRDYLQSSETVELPSNYQLDDSTPYPYDSPKIISLNDNRLISFWCTDNGEETNDLSFIKLVYSIRDSRGNWSTPEVVYDSPGSDFNPVITTDGTNVYVLWERLNTNGNTAINPETGIQNIVLVTSTFDGQTSEFSEVTQLTEPGLAPVIYALDTNEGEVYISYLTNSENDFTLTEGTNNLYYGTLDNPTLINDSLGSVSSIALNESDLYYIEANETEDENQVGSIYAVQPNGSVSVLVENATDIGQLKTNNDQLYWVQDGLLYILSNNEIVKTNVEIGGTYEVLSTNDKITVIDNITDGFTSQLNVSQSTDGNIWSEPLVYSSYNQTITNFSSVIDPKTNAPLLAYVYKEVDNSEAEEYNFNPYSNPVFVIAPLEEQWDLEVDPILYYDSSKISMGQENEFTAVITNKSTQPIITVTADLTDGNNQPIDTIVLPVFIKPNDTNSVSFSVDIPEVNSYTINATFSPNGNSNNNPDTNMASVTIDEESYIEPYPFYTVTTSSSPSEGGTVTGSGNYQSGSDVVIEAVADIGYSFDYWLINGERYDFDSTLHFPIEENMTVEAVFFSHSSIFGISPNIINLATVDGGIQSTNINMTILQPQPNATISWESQNPNIATITPSSDLRSATVNAVNEGDTIIVVRYGEYSAKAFVQVRNNPVISDGIQITTSNPDFFSLRALNVRANPAVNASGEIQKVSMFEWSETNQNDINAKVAHHIEGTNDWEVINIPVNDNAINNWFEKADSLYVHVYGSLDASNDGNIIGVSSYKWLNNANAFGKNVGYITYLDSYGFERPTRLDGEETSSNGLALKGLRISSNIEGVNVLTSVHQKDSGWLENISDGTFAGTMDGDDFINAIQFNLEGDNAAAYRIQYKVYIRNQGWTEWSSDGDTLGTEYSNNPIEAIAVRII